MAVKTGAGFRLRSVALAGLTGVFAALAGCTNHELLGAHEEMREELEMLRDRLARLASDTAKHSRKIQELSELEEKRGGETEGGEPVPAEDLAVGLPADSADSTAGRDRVGGGASDGESAGTHEAPTDPFARRVQIALKRAGFNPGPVDAKAGAMTKKAIREFQRENNLPETGVADEATWDLLKRYLE